MIKYLRIPSHNSLHAQHFQIVNKIQRLIIKYLFNQTYLKQSLRNSFKSDRSEISEKTYWKYILASSF